MAKSLFEQFSGTYDEENGYLIPDLKQYRRGTYIKLKAENTLEWTGRMNNIRARAREIINKEIIYA